MIKTIYFVRHGQTQMNHRHIHQLPDEPLNERGKEQAVVLAKDLNEFPIDTIVSSPYTRARETANIDGEAIGIPVEISSSLTEIRRPDSVYGKLHYSFASFWYVVQLYFHGENPRWDHENAENLYHIRNRVHDAKDFLAAQEGSHIVVASHSIFMNLFIAFVCDEVELTFYEFVRALFKTTRTKNTAMIKITFDPKAAAGTCAWQVMSN